MSNSLLLPAAVLVLWSMLVMIWFTYARFSSIAKMKGQFPPTPVGVRGADFDPQMPNIARFASHNYTHLMEQPTIFYPAVVILHLAGGTNGTTLALAWAYVVLRILHSLWQLSVNKIPVRIALFGLSSICLVGLAVRAVLATI